MEMKQKLLEAMGKVSDEDFKNAAERWLDGFNAEGMLDNFISILSEYYQGE